MVGSPTGLTDVPFVEVGHLRRKLGRAAPARVLERGQRGPQWCPCRLQAVRPRGRGRWGGFAVDLHVLAQGARVGVGFVTTSDFAEIWLVTGMDVRVFFPVTAVCKFPVAAIKLAFKRLLS